MRKEVARCMDHIFHRSFEGTMNFSGKNADVGFRSTAVRRLIQGTLEIRTILLVR